MTATWSLSIMLQAIGPQREAHEAWRVTRPGGSTTKKTEGETDEKRHKGPRTRKTGSHRNPEPYNLNPKPRDRKDKSLNTHTHPDLHTNTNTPTCPRRHGENISINGFPLIQPKEQHKAACRVATRLLSLKLYSQDAASLSRNSSVLQKIPQPSTRVSEVSLL